METTTLSQSPEAASPLLSKASARARTQKLGQVYLSFRLNDKTPALLSTQHSQEIIDVPASQITAMPHMAPGVLGLFNSRGHIFWMVDLAQWMGLEPLPVDINTYSVIVLRVPTQPSEQLGASLLQSDYVLMGFAVQLVKGSLRLPETLIKPVTESFSATLAPYLSGLILHQAELHWVLDAEAIARLP